MRFAPFGSDAALCDGIISRKPYQNKGLIGPRQRGGGFMSAQFRPMRIGVALRLAFSCCRMIYKGARVNEARL
jgi:hypothetical protein